MTDSDQLGERLRARGMRLTSQRERVLRAVGRLGHATPEEVLAVVNDDGGVSLPPSTVYRALEALETSGAVRHTHLDHRAPSYQLDGHDEHIHLVCRSCGGVDEVPVALLADAVGIIAAQTGFDAELSHNAIHGRCLTCRNS